MNRGGSNRIGWNARGGTDSDHFQLAMEQSERNNPDSNYWRDLAQIGFDDIKALLKDDYKLWAEMTWPRDEINTHNWKEIYTTLKQALNAGKDALLDSLECRCYGVAGQYCKVCEAQKRLTYGG